MTHGVQLNAADVMRAVGALKVGTSAFSSCQVVGGTAPGLVDMTCANADASTATLTTGVALTGTFRGHVSTDDATSAFDSIGLTPFANLNDWLSFDNPFRAFGRDGLAFPNASDRGRCAAGDGVCRIWDWRVLDTDTAVRNVAPVPTSSGVFTHTWDDGSSTTALLGAAELFGDGIGDDDGSCENNESCLHLPAAASHQGDGARVRLPDVISGTVANVVLWQTVR